MYHTGELWMKNEISVAEEHLITAITLSMMTLVRVMDGGYQFIFEFQAAEQERNCLRAFRA
jgi:hypothetical protein